MHKAEETILEIDLSALAHNYRYLRSKLEASTQLLAVVKAYGYGSDAVAIASKLEALGIDYFAVAYTSEGIALRKAGITSPILVLHPLTNAFQDIIEHCLEPSLYSLRTLQAFIQSAIQLKQHNYPVHLKYNSGLNRLGFSNTDLNELFSSLKSETSIKTKSVFSHLVASEDLSEKDFTHQQISAFISFYKRFEKEIGYMPMRHQTNTSGIINYPDAHFDMVRTGIGLYGYGNTAREDNNLKPIAQLKSVISQIHHINSGESVGYNRGFVASKPITSATIPIGHADGIGRHYGKGKAAFIVNGKAAPILGNVCMDMVMINVTHIDCEEGDEVIIFGDHQNASKFAQSAGTISYEILTAISQRVKRVVLDT